MSLEANKALIQRWVAAWACCDLGAIDVLFAPAYAVNEAPIGPEGVKQAVQLLHAAFSPLAVTLDELIAEGDQVVARWTAAGVHTGVFLGIPATGQHVQFTGINIYRIANGQIVANREQVDVAGLRQQLEAGGASSEA
jgi:steroid delta-isomerase-like uncharacterized protein